jgi:predicted hotdog family 3-hydroxylacyl-ACP dehydratase
LLFCDRLFTKTSYVVTKECLFVGDGRLSAVGLIENMAQTTAARMGYLALYGDQCTGKVRVGVIGAIRHLTIERTPQVGTLLTTSINLVEELGDLILVKAKVENGTTLLASCDMIVSLI